MTTKASGSKRKTAKHKTAKRKPTPTPTINDQVNDQVNLRCDAIDSAPITIDWQESMGEDMEGWRAFEASTCPKCGRIVVTSNTGEIRCRDALPKIAEVVTTEEHGRTIEEEIEVPNTCRGTFYSEGPMMNCWYPVAIDDCADAARKIAHLPLCVVEFQDGQTGLALTGGGMDLSWEICAAFIALGSYPPVYFCDLPRMAGRKSERDLATIAACVEACRIAEAWTARKRERLLALKSDALKGTL